MASKAERIPLVGEKSQHGRFAYTERCPCSNASATDLPVPRTLAVLNESTRTNEPMTTKPFGWNVIGLALCSTYSPLTSGFFSFPCRSALHFSRVVINLLASCEACLLAFALARNASFEP